MKFASQMALFVVGVVLGFCLSIPDDRIENQGDVDSNRESAGSSNDSSTVTDTETATTDSGPNGSPQPSTSNRSLEQSMPLRKDAEIRVAIDYVDRNTTCLPQHVAAFLRQGDAVGCAAYFAQVIDSPPPDEYTQALIINQIPFVDRLSETVNATATYLDEVESLPSPPWTDDRFQVLGTTRGPSPTTIPGRDFTLPASPEHSLLWYEESFSTTESPSMAPLALAALKRYESERRETESKILQEILAFSKSEQGESTVVAYAIIDGQLYVVNHQSRTGVAHVVSGDDGTIPADVQLEVRSLLE